MKKHRIVLASVLKPLDDTRMLGKMGVTLAAGADFEVFIIGASTAALPEHAHIHFVPLPPLGRLSWKRVTAPLSVLKNIVKVKPQIVLVNTHELLIVAILSKILFGAKIIYDVRENYFRNILYTAVYPWGVRHLLAALVRIKEMVAGLFFDHFILAEQSYREEMKFFKDRYTLLENKSLPSRIRSSPVVSQGVNLLFSGTIDYSTGIFQVIALAKEMHRCNEAVRLHVIGYCALKRVRQKILAACSDCHFIRFTGFDRLVSHDRIMEEIRKAHFGIVYYPSSPHTAGLMPTKLYEYMGSRLPILTWEDQHFAKDVVSNQAGLLVPPSVTTLLAQIKNATFYPRPIDGIYWEGETLLNLMTMLLAKSGDDLTTR